MKTFEAPVANVKKFDLVDILTASGDPVVPVQTDPTEPPCPRDVSLPCLDD